MHDYALKYFDQKKKRERFARFEADNVGAALIRANEIASSWPLEIWEDEERVCSIVRHPVGGQEVWTMTN